ncbi:uncharacterized protein [Primulina huaijiensis]|uniref:uncharacterized protein n=1 Tax=Primulina huaijiensis TaxID=1492673 RepID=UPI003CC704F4
MEFKAILIGTLLLFIIVVAPSFSAGKLQVKSKESDVYDIDYRGPETHTYLPPPNLAADQPNVDTIAGMAHHGSRVREVQKHEKNFRG